MNKEEAAAFLGISVRSLQRLVSNGQIPPAQKVMMRRDGDNQAREVALFDEAALTAYKEQPPPRTSAMTVTTENKLARQSRQPITDTTGAADSTNRMIAAMEAQTVGQKILLSLADARTLTGLSREHLIEAIKTGKLKGRIIGRGYKVKRTDLDSYIRKL